VRKSDHWGEGKYRWEKNSPSLQQGMAAGGSYLPCRLREGDLHDGGDSNLIETRSCEKKFRMVGGNKKNRKPHHHPPLHATCKRAMAAAGSYSPCWLRVGELRHGQNNNLIEKSCSEKHQEWGKDNNHRQTHHRRLGVVSFAGRHGSDGPLIPLLIKGGRPARLTE
jgi:hypothetical protein